MNLCIYNIILYKFIHFISLSFSMKMLFHMNQKVRQALLNFFPVECCWSCKDKMCCKRQNPGESCNTTERLLYELESHFRQERIFCVNSTQVLRALIPDTISYKAGKHCVSCHPHSTKLNHEL